MPWQAVPGFAIIVGAFSVSGGLCHGIQKLVMGKDREVLRDNWSYGLETRDEQVFAFRKMGTDGPSAAETEDALQKQLEEIRKSS